jgi:2-polyprenyl-3-methyl-5-hydroxy-6-metoxy-1,4-benzoquinol methylase
MSADFPDFSCVLCCGNNADLVVRSNDGRTIVRCCTCSMICVHPFPAKETLNALYQGETYFGPARMEGNVGYLTDTIHRDPASKENRERLSQILCLRQRRGTLLDVGCAYGQFLRLARRAGWQPIGIELSQSAAKAAREEFGLHVMHGTLETATLSDETMDAVTVWEVIEHVPSPLDTLRHIFRLLKPGGVVALSTPNAGSLRARQEGPDWYGYHLSREHLLFFTAGTLARALETVGFHVVSIRTHHVNPSLRRLVSKRTVQAKDTAECHPGLCRPATILESFPVRAFLRLRGIVLRPLEAFGLGHTLEVYGVKPG